MSLADESGSYSETRIGAGRHEFTLPFAVFGGYAEI